MSALDLSKKISSSDYIKIIGGLLTGIFVTLGFFFTPIAHLPLLWIYGEDFDIELVSPTELNVGEIAEPKFIIMPRSFLGVSSGTVKIIVGEKLSYRNQKKHVLNFSKLTAPKTLSEPNIKIKGNNEGVGNISLLVKTAYKPEGYEEKLFTISISKRKAGVVSRGDFSGTWNMSLEENFGIMKITDSNGVMGGVYEFQNLFENKHNGSLEGWHDGELFKTNLNFGEGKKIFINGLLKYHPDFVEVRGTATIKIKKQGEQGFWHDEKELSFGASAALLSNR